RAHSDEFAARRNKIEAAVTRQLAAFCVFVADIELQGRAPERLEAAIMGWTAPPPFCDIPDKGMVLAPRLSGEEPITVLNAAPASSTVYPNGGRSRLTAAPPSASGSRRRPAEI